MTDTATWISAVRSSHDRFAGLLGPLSDAEVEGPSYASEWSIADTASHLGSQAEIFGLFLDAGLERRAAPGGDVFPTIWDRWNALAPVEQVHQSVAANEAFVTRVEALSDDEREGFSSAAFGRETGLGELLSLRLGELALHTWDIAVALDATATVSGDAVDVLVDQLPATAARAGRPAAGVDPVDLVTTDPSRTFRLDVGDPVTLGATAEPGAEPLTLPAEALVRLVYGRLDTAHAPAGLDDPRLAELRAVFPGF